jgi:hypothetical protein
MVKYTLPILVLISYALQSFDPPLGGQGGKDPLKKKE